MDKFPEPVIIKIVKLVGINNNNIKMMRLVCKQIKNVVDKQVTCISPFAISSKRLIGASRQFPKINTLNLKQTIMQDEFVYFDDGDNVEGKEKPKMLPFYRCCAFLLEKEKQHVLAIPVDQFLNFHNLTSLQLQYCFEQHTNVCRLISALSHQISNLEIEFVRQQSGSIQQHDILFLLHFLKQTNNLRILTPNNKKYCEYDVDVIPPIAQLIHLEELHILGTIGTGQNAIKQLATLTSLHTMHLQNCYNIDILARVQDWVEFLLHFKFLQSFMLYDHRLYECHLLEAVAQFPNTQTVGCAVTARSGHIYKDFLVQISQIKSKFYLQFFDRYVYNFVNDYLKVVPSTCIHDLGLFAEKREEVCEYLKSVDLTNLKKLELGSQYTQTKVENILRLHKLKQLTYLRLEHNDHDLDLCALSNIPNLKLLKLYLGNSSVRYLQGLSQLCAKGTLQRLVIRTVDFNTTFVDSICVPGCNLRDVYIRIKEVTSMQEFKRMVQYIFDKLEGVLNRIPRVEIFQSLQYEVELFSIVQQERRRRQLNMISRESSLSN